MQIHFDRASFSPFGEPHFNAIDSASPFAALPIGPVRLTILNEDEADQLIERACQIKEMFRQHKAERGETSEPGEFEISQGLADALSADLDESPAPGPASSMEDEDDAFMDWEDDGSAEDDAGRAIAADLPAEERPDNGPQRADAIGDYDCRAQDEGFTCTAAPGHTGYHMAYGSRVRDGELPPSLCHSWPQESAGDDAGRAIAATDNDEQPNGAA